MFPGQLQVPAYCFNSDGDSALSCEQLNVNTSLTPSSSFLLRWRQLPSMWMYLWVYANCLCGFGCVFFSLFVCGGFVLFCFAFMRSLMVLFSWVAAKLCVFLNWITSGGRPRTFPGKTVSDEKRVPFLSSGRRVLSEGKPSLLSFLFSLVSLAYFSLWPLTSPLHAPLRSRVIT